MVDICRTAGVGAIGAAPTKGQPVRVIDGWARDGLSDKAADCRDANAVSVSVYASGSSISATVSVEGSEQEGGQYLPLPDPNATQAVTGSLAFDCVVGPAWAKVRISNYVAGVFYIIVTPFRSPGLPKVTIGSSVTIVEAATVGTFTTPVPAAIDVTNVSGLVLAANPDRKYVLLQNVSDTDIWINLGDDAVVNGGFAKLVASRGAFQMTAREGNLYSGQIHAIHNGTGNKRLLVFEGI